MVLAMGGYDGTGIQDCGLNCGVRGGAGSMAEMSDSDTEGSGRKPREYGKGASNSAARKEFVRPEVVALMEAVVARENLLKAYAQVMSNKGAAGVDNMSVEQLKPYLQEHWAQIKESLLSGTYQPAAVRGVEIPKPSGGVRQLGIKTVADGAGSGDSTGVAAGLESII